ncbi:MAG: hypothetical protein RIT45_848, partial [Pseudomonadota bacterium]
MRTTPNSSASRWPRLAATLSIGAVLVAGCSDDPASNNGANAAKTYGLPAGVLKTLETVNTSLDKSEILAGEQVQVACVGDPGSVQIPEPEFDVLPADGWTREGSRLTFTKAGSFSIACKLHDGKVVDDTPATLKVAPAAAVKVTATVEPTKIGAGAKATASCRGEDTFGNVIDDATEGWTVAVTPSDLGDVDGKAVEGRKVGKGEVKCTLASATGAAQTAASLEVVAGAPAKTIATVDPSTIVAGDAGAAVTCAVEDAFGNAVAAPGELTIDTPEGVSVSGKSVTSNVAGKHEITCNIAGAKLTKEAAKLTVKPAEAIDWELQPKVVKDVWAAGDVVVLVGLGKDKFGNEIQGMKTAAPATYSPAEFVKENQIDGITKSYTLLGDGNFTFTTKLDAETWGAELADKLGPKTLQIKADSTGPLVLITNPARGETRNGDAKVVVKGTVLDELSATKAFTINGQAVTFGGDGSFEFTIDSAQGMNAIIWTAEDEWKNVSNGVQSYYYSTLWLPAQATPASAAAVDDGIGVWLSQQIIDSGKHDHKNPKDLATVAEVIIGTLDFGALINGASGGSGAYLFPINTTSPGLKWSGGAKIANVLMGDKTFNNGYPEISLTVIDGGIHMAMKIHKFSSDLVLEIESVVNPNPFNLKPTKFNQTATMSAKSIELSMDLMLTLDPATGKIKSEAKSVDLNLVDLNIQLSGVLGFLTNWLLQAAGPVLEATLETIAKTQLNNLIGGQIGTLLESLAIEQSFDLGPLFGTGDPTKLTLSSKVGQLIFKPTKAQAGGILLGLDAAMTAAKKVDYKPLGSIGRAACLEPGGKEVFNPGLKFPLEAGLRDDFVNELLFALWWGGLLELDIGADALGGFDMSSFGVSDLSVQTDFMLPPILNTCAGADLKLQVGDLRLHAVLKLNGTPVDIWMYATLQATASLKAVKSPKTGEMEIGFELKSIDFLEIEIEKINEDAKDLKDVFLTLIKTILLPKLTEGLGSGLGSFPLP